MSNLVSPQWLFERLNDPRTVVLDCSIDFQIPSETEKDKRHVIPTALRFDYDQNFCDPTSSLPHMMPSEALFNHKAQALGLNNDSVIVVYDNSGTFASPRAWWMFKAMGHKQVYVLDGGLTQWKSENFPLNIEHNQLALHGNFEGAYQTDYFVDADYVLAQLNRDTSLTIDARSLARFNGSVAEPRAGVRSGHIPNSICLPFATLMTGHRLKPLNELTPIIHSALGQAHQEYIFSCGSGVTACIVLLAAAECGYTPLRVYDGSWTEWGQNHTLPIA
jgi:thiosulfate/3-mercaptopyruvate sulfurtransferase